jgi:hypothetical protein
VESIELAPMIPILSKGFLEKFTREHPLMARAILGFGALMVAFTIWLIVTR